MASNAVGAAGMVRIQYLGKKMSSVWPGHVTNADYVFGADKPIGWVDPRDAGEKGKSGFLNSKDGNGNFIFQVVAEKKAAASTKEPELVVEMIMPVVRETVDSAELAVEKVPAGRAGAVQVGGALSVTEKTAVLDVTDPTDHNVEEIKRWNLSKEQWIEIYRIELANRHRKGLLAFLEEKLADWKD